MSDEEWYRDIAQLSGHCLPVDEGRFRVPNELPQCLVHGLCPLHRLGISVAFRSWVGQSYDNVDGFVDGFHDVCDVVE